MYHYMDPFSVHPLLNGILPVLPTPFRDDGRVDPDAFRRLVQFSIAAGVNGMVYPGFASEVETLTLEDRTLCLGIAAEEAVEGVALVAGASADGVNEVIRHCAVASSLGIPFVMIQPPKHLGVESGTIIEFLRTIGDAHPGLRIILQNAPAPRGSNLRPEVLLEVVSAIPQLAYVKEETIPAGPAISQILSNTERPKHFLGMIGGGGARYILDEYGREACAAMPAVELADLHVALDAAWREGRRDEARDIYVRTRPLLTLQAAYRMRLTKYVMMRRGILTNAIVRVPLPALDSHAVADIEANLELLGLLDEPGLAQELVA